jgi:phage terminase large subunit-like protein
MTEALERSALTRWRRNPLSFVEQILRDPETQRPFVLLPEQREFFKQAWQTDDDGRLLYPEQVYGAIKKSGKSGTAALHVLTTTLVHGGRFAEGYCVANDLEQAQGRVYLACRRIVEASPHLKREADITQSRITFPQTGATVQAIGSDYAGAAGGNPTISSFDELWAYTSERSRRLWDEMVPVPTRKISARLTTSYAGFEGESLLLEELYKRGLAQPVIGNNNLHAGDGLLMFWSHAPIAPWQSEAWLSEMRRSLRPNQFLRMIENRFVTTESDFVPLAAWDRCVIPNIGHTLTNPALAIYAGVDASVKHDQTAIVATTFDARAQQVKLVTHRVFQPSPTQPLDFEHTVETFIRDLAKRFRLRRCLYDPYQMQASAQRLLRDGIPMVEFPQSVPNLTAASQNLYDLIIGGNLSAYPDAAMRLAVSRCVAVETSRGWRIAKERQAHKIDVIIALAQAAYAAIQSQTDEDQYSYSLAAFDPNFTDLDDPRRGTEQQVDEARAARQYVSAQEWGAILNGSLDRGR